MDDPRPFFKNMLKSTFKTKVGNSEDISSPIVSAIEENTRAVKDREVAKQISKPIVTALVDVMGKIEEKKDSDDGKIEKLLERIEVVKGEPGKDAHTPTDDEILGLIKPLIPEPVPGMDGKDYVLTEKDKKEIAKSIKVPVVEKVIEKQFETIIEKQPIVTNEIKEVAVTDKAEVLKEKLESLEGDDRLDAKAIKNLPKSVFGGGGGIKRIDAANDTRIISPTNGQTLVWNSTRQVWENSSSGGGSGVVETIVAGTNIDVDATDPANPIVSVETLTLADVSDVTASTAEVNVLDGIPATLTATELGYVDGVTSAIQTQLDAKLDDSQATAFGLSLLDDANAAAGRTTLELVAGGTGDIWVEKAGDTMTGALAISLATGNSLVVDTNTFVVDASNNRIGIGTTSPQALFDIGGLITDAADISTTNPVAIIGANANSVSGVVMGNLSTGGTADFRFAIKDTQDAYLAFAMPGTGNAASLLGQTRSTSAFIFTNNNTVGTKRNLTIGTVDAKDLIFGTSDTERMRILSGGNVGIGTTGPDEKLHVLGGNIKLSNNQSLVFGDDDQTALIKIYGDTNANNLNFRTNNQDRLTINSSGNVGINTTAPSGKLEVAQNITAYPTTGAYGQLELTGSTTPAMRLSMGVRTDVEKGFIQSVKSSAAYRDLLLNPSGGNVGIGVTGTPGGVLEVVGYTRVTNGNIEVYDTTNAPRGVSLYRNSISLGGMNTNSNQVSFYAVTGYDIDFWVNSSALLAMKIKNSTGSVQVNTQIELGHATDTTLSRSAAGQLAVEGVDVLTTSNTKTLSNKSVSGALTLEENASIALDPAGSADGKYSGITVTGTAGATLAFGDLIYLDPTDSRWELCDGNAAAGADGDARGMIGMCVLAAAADGNATTILLQGIIRADANFPALTIGAPVYVAETAGDVVVTQPTTTDAVIRQVGFAMTADELYFNPTATWTTHT